MSQVDVRNPRVSIEYCTKCRWMLRAAYFGQELLTTFDTAIGELALIPGDSAVFRVKVNDVLIWDRKEKGGFPEVKELKQLVRDVIAPDMPLGHSDRKKAQAVAEPKKEEETKKADGVCETCVE
ncbi:Rdx family-domain-containing protein [Syncephalastrum racemosum]|uniref:Rdx family-domain-containing protein n=1 Tax=Syncephalastrum racemosum TaxID=13706 RepID=A0A1X2HAA9_SYNRA|nr:Rdx family-domain-containing protein [Syncephalastrum racemosum]